MKVSFKILKLISDLFKEKNILWATEISNLLWKSRTIIHKWLKELLEKKEIKKIWKWAHIKYKIIFWEKKLKNEEKNEENFYKPDFKTQKILENIFYKFSPEWEILQWFLWIKKWCKSRNLNLEKKISNYIKIHNHIEEKQDLCGLISAKENFWEHFEEVFLDNIFYADQYKWMEFWRWKLAEMTFYAKQSQNKKLINESLNEIFIKIECIIQKENFDAIAITPWSIDRKNQLLWFLKNKMQIFDLPFVNVIKYYPNEIAIPQKSLKKREERIQNARNTIFIDDKNIKKYKKVFLIDDFVWSGSTLNETASKLKKEWVKNVIWFAFVWNLNLDYEVINEV